MSWEGVGPKLALSVMPYLILVIAVMIYYPDFLKINFIPRIMSIWISIIWGSLGLLFYGFTAYVFFRNFFKDKLITSGTFALSRNPIYASFIFFFLPALAVFFNSWLLFSVAVVLYINFKLLIQEEYKILEENFGKDFLSYRKRVNELFPFPKLGKK